MPRSCLLGTNLEPQTQLWGNVPASFLETDCNFCFESSFGTDRSFVSADSQAPPAPGLWRSYEGLKQRQGDTCVTGRLSRSFDLHVTIRPCCCLMCLVTVQAGRVGLPPPQIHPASVPSWLFQKHPASPGPPWSGALVEGVALSPAQLPHIDVSLTPAELQQLSDEACSPDFCLGACRPSACKSPSVSGVSVLPRVGLRVTPASNFPSLLSDSLHPCL